MYIIALSPLRARFARMVRAVTAGFAFAAGRASDIRASSAAFCLAAFAAGSAGGILFSRLVPGGEAPFLPDASLLEVYISAYCNGSLLRWTAGELMWPVFVFLGGFSVIGLWLIPLAAVFRGFVTALAAALLARTSADAGLGSVWLLWGPTAVFSVPCFLTLASAALTEARKLRERALGGNGPRPYGLRYGLLVLIMTAIMTLSSILKYWIAQGFTP